MFNYFKKYTKFLTIKESYLEIKGYVRNISNNI
jgi:hypothetical protein